MGKPFFVDLMEKNDLELLKNMSSLREFAMKEGALPAKVKILMCLLADAILGHPEGVKALAEEARTQGATEGEIAETVRMAFFLGGLPGLVVGTFAFQG